MIQPGDTFTADLPLVRANGDTLIPSPNWRQALEAAVAQHPHGNKGVAELLGVSRTYVSRVMTGHMPVAPLRFIERVRNTLQQVHCPHLRRPLPPADCRAYAHRTYAQVSQFEVDHWRACRACPNRPASPDGELTPYPRAPKHRGPTAARAPAPALQETHKETLEAAHADAV